MKHDADGRIFEVGARPARFHRHCGARCFIETAAAASPAATAASAWLATSDTGPRAARPRSRTSCCSVVAITVPSTRGLSGGTATEWRARVPPPGWSCDSECAVPAGGSGGSGRYRQNGQRRGRGRRGSMDRNPRMAGRTPRRRLRHRRAPPAGERETKCRVNDTHETRQSLRGRDRVASRPDHNRRSASSRSFTFGIIPERII